MINIIRSINCIWIVVIVFNLLLLDANCQVGGVTDKQVRSFENTTLLVVKNLLTQYIDYDILEAAIQENWNFTKVKFIEQSQQSDYIGNPEFSFLKIWRNEYTGSEYSDGCGAVQLTVYYMSKKKAHSISDYEILGNVLVNSKLNGCGNLNYHGKVEFDSIAQDVVMSLQNFFILAKENGGFRTMTSILSLYQLNKYELKKKTLLIDKRIVDEAYSDNESAFSEVYNYEVDLVNEEFILEAIKERNSEYAYFYYSMDVIGRCHVMIIEAGSGKILWYEIVGKKAPLYEPMSPAFLIQLN